MSTVTVTLDRADAETWLGYHREHRLTGWERRCRDALAVALDRDPKELVERIGMALSARHGSEVIWPDDREAAKSVLAALEGDTE